MNKDEFRELLDELGLKPDDLAKLTGVSLRSAYRYLDGSRPVGPAVSSYLKLYAGLSPEARAAEHARAGLTVQP